LGFFWLIKLNYINMTEKIKLRRHCLNRNLYILT
jgi:hypothetical protein